jgi:hypothetical protein
VASVRIAILIVANSRHTVVLAKATSVRDAALARERQCFAVILHEVPNGVFAASVCHSIADVASVAVATARDRNALLSLPQVSTVSTGVLTFAGLML